MMPAMPEDLAHIPVLMRPVLELLDPKPGHVFLDCTVGRGGHALQIIPRLAPSGRYIALDMDPANIDHVRQVLRDSPVPLDAVRGNFADARSVLDSLGIEAVDGLLADLGFASTQMDAPARGMSFTRPGPLDMRLDPSLPMTAADWVNRADAQELVDIFYQYGEERLSRRIVQKIVETRRKQPINTTSELAEICEEAYGSRRYRQKVHPATRVFQALRIAVNRELDNLAALLGDLPGLLRPAGRAGIISFHSLEDRMVKQAFARYHEQGLAERLTRKPVEADEQEIAMNRRSRSAKLRVIRRLGG